MSRTLSEPEKKIVAARQGWRCSACECVLPSAYQIDHTIALGDGGVDAISNATAMCANCHAQKTQREAASRAIAKRSADVDAAYDDRIDWDLPNNMVRCDACRKIRKSNTPHMVCFTLEDPDGCREKILLNQFTFRRR